MTARSVHSVLAAGVAKPNLIDLWRQHPQLLRDEGVDPDSIDLSALRKFAGLGAKVRHNALRQDLPLSFRLMHLAGLEIEIFSSYACYCAALNHAFAPTSQQRLRDLLAFLEHSLDSTRRDHALLWDIIRHENAISQLAKLPFSAADHGADSGSPRPAAGRTPVVCGEILLYEMRCDPQLLATALRQSSPPLTEVISETVYQSYWRSDRTGDIQLLRLDEFGYYALSGVDGEKTVTDLCLQLTGSSPPKSQFLKVLGQLGDVGILRFRPAARQHAS